MNKQKDAEGKFPMHIQQGNDVSLILTISYPWNTRLDILNTEVITDKPMLSQEMLTYPSWIGQSGAVPNVCSFFLGKCCA